MRKLKFKEVQLLAQGYGGSHWWAPPPKNLRLFQNTILALQYIVFLLHIRLGDRIQGEMGHRPCTPRVYNPLQEADWYPSHHHPGHLFSILRAEEVHRGKFILHQKSQFLQREALWTWPLEGQEGFYKRSRGRWQRHKGTQVP